MSGERDRFIPAGRQLYTCFLPHMVSITPFQCGALENTWYHRKRMRQSLHSQDLGLCKMTVKRGHIPENPSLIYFIMSSILPKPIYKLLHLMHTEYLAKDILFLEDSFA